MQKKKAKNNKKVAFKKKNNISGKRKLKRNIYSQKALEYAVFAVKNGASYRKAARMFVVPLTAVFRAQKNPCQEKVKFNKCTVFSEEEELKISDWVLYRAKRGHPVTKTQLLDCVQAYVIQSNKKTPLTEGRPSRHWYESFLKRHSNLSIRTAQHLTLTRATVSEENLRDWFLEIKTHLSKENLIFVHPSRIYNCDETNVQLMPKPDKVLTKKGAHSVYKIVDGGEKENLTVLFMYNADGTRAPPMVMYKYKESVPKKILQSCPSEWGIGISESGWMTSETFYEYITNIFYPWLLKNNIEIPVIIYLDGHSSHVTIPLVKFCRDNGIELISLYPNATHILQPLDIAVFHPFKQTWKNTVARWKVENNTIKLKKEDFGFVLQKALESFTEEKNIVKSGFKAAGLFPFNPEAVDYNILQKKRKGNNCSTKKQINQEIREGNLQHLLTFESNLSQDLILEFKAAEFSGVRNYDIQNENLFKYWLKIKKSAYDNNSSQIDINTENIYVNNERPVYNSLLPIEEPIILEDNLNVNKNNLILDNIPAVDGLCNIDIVDRCKESLQNADISAYNCQTTDEISIPNNLNNVYIMKRGDTTTNASQSENSRNHLTESYTNSILFLDTDSSKYSEIIILPNNLNNNNIIQAVNTIIKASQSENSSNNLTELCTNPTLFLDKQVSVAQPTDLSKYSEKIILSNNLNNNNIIQAGDTTITASQTENNSNHLTAPDRNPIFLGKQATIALPSHSSNYSELLTFSNNLNINNIVQTGDITEDSQNKNSNNYLTKYDRDGENKENVRNKGQLECHNEKSFANAFTLPVEFLPLKKKMKIEKSGKQKLPAVGTGNEWWSMHLEKEEKRKLKDEKIAEKRLLQEEKKRLAEEKKRLQLKIADIQKNIKAQKLKEE